MRTRRKFVTSDTHFGHTNILKFEPIHRPFNTIEEHDEALVGYWNDTVGPNDIVYHLGDAVFKKHNLDILGRLNGEITLIMGNHDHYPAEEYLKYVKTLQGAMYVAGIIMTHIPIHEQHLYRFRGNIHGHMHSTTMDDPRYICASVEQTNLRPILLDTLLNRLPIKV